MTRRAISQKEARALQQRVHELEVKENNRRKQWVTEYPDGVHIGSLSVSDVTFARVRTARLLGHAVVVTEANNEINFYALPIVSEQPA
ncbi:MAG: hypothetical protein GAK28_00576 [Luteibacter sp.]|uniref:hypothetical protein n=1 Tax=Luteibacter sp. TaxID=1886636 RepID=UPI001382D57A|nr:hypothetical protein [Luteibacter sp.]KAF1008944.1 MAG: hypothetical protein GAK28_00576 [Luteibacter sp.]